MSDGENQPKPTTETTRQANAAVAAALPLADQADFDRVRRGLIAEAPEQVTHEFGHAVWDRSRFAFLDATAPDEVNPSLWRQAQLNAIAGLFEVAPGFYQVRGLDMANVTFIEGREGWVVIDPLTTAETAAAALALANEHLGERPVTTVIYTHSHADHFGGVRGIADEHDVVSGKVPIVAPEGFLHAAISENVIAGNVMNRRASYMYGALLPPGPTGHVDSGLGKALPLFGSTGLIAPTVDVAETGTVLDLDGVTVEFQVTPDTEAPAEMNFWFPDHRVLCMAENCTANLHNLYTPRGAQIRDALSWSIYIDESLVRYGDRSDVVFASHHWPRWGDDGRTYLAQQRDTYRFIHDQTMRLANHGLTMTEIAETLELPPGLAAEFHVRGYYGTLNHNVKAVYQRYLGWFDGNPAHLHPHPPVEAARRYVDFMGGADAVLERARASFDEGDYRWVAEVVNHVVFADPDNQAARRLQADALEQLGYQAESGPWRDFYLTGAQELRHGHPNIGAAATASSDVLRAMTTEMLLQLVGVRLDGSTADDVTFGVVVTDREETWAVGVSNGALHHRSQEAVDGVPVLRLPHLGLAELAGGATPLAELVASGEATIEGDGDPLYRFFDDLDQFSFGFPIVTP